MNAGKNVDDTPDWLLPATRAALIGTIGLIALALGLVLAGIANPPRFGELIIDADAPTALTLGADHIVYLDAGYSVHCPCTLEMTARQISGAPEARVGLWWQDEENERVVIAVSGTGYYGVIEGEEEVLEWQRFPWLLRGDANRLRADIGEDGGVTFRINDEVAANFTWQGGMAIEIGFYGETGETAANITVEKLQVWSVNP